MGSIREREDSISELFLPRLSENVSIPWKTHIPDRHLTIQAIQVALYPLTQLTLITYTKKISSNRRN